MTAPLTSKSSVRQIKQGSLRGLAAWLILAFLAVGCSQAAPLVQEDGLLIGVASSLFNAFPDEAPRPEHLTESMNLAAARRESQSAQIVIHAAETPLSVSRVAVDNLRSGDGAVISADAVEVRLVGYVHVERSSWRGVRRLGLWPDPLLAWRPFTCPAGETRSLWVTISVPPQAAAGSYQGEIRLYGDNNTLLAKVPVDLAVWNFTLPIAPVLETSYWANFVSRYDVETEPQAFADFVNLFGEYRVSTNLWTPGSIQWRRDANGDVSCDISGMIANLEMAVAAGFRTLNCGAAADGCWGVSRLNNRSIIDEATGEALTAEAAQDYPRDLAAELYLSQLADWLEDRDLLDRAYIQVYDEAMHPEKWPEIAASYRRFRNIEPRMRWLGLTGIHPEMQGLYDIWSPHQHFYDAATYEMVRQGVALYGHKNFPAAVTASSTGGWGNASFYKYRPIDAYDGCVYTKWIPAEKPTVEEPQWLAFSFDQPQDIDGLSIIPYGNVAGGAWRCEASVDGETFETIELSARPDEPHTYSFDRGKYRAVRLVWTEGERGFAATPAQPVPAPEPLTSGVRQVEFLARGVPREATFPRGQNRPAEMWEYQVGADYPSANIDADPIEMRAMAWRLWRRNVTGYLNYGAGQWSMARMPRPEDEDPLVWSATGYDNGSEMFCYPGRDRVLPSIRMARFRDGVNDYDYLFLLRQRDPDHPLLDAIDRAGTASYANAHVLQANRHRLGESLNAP